MNKWTVKAENIAVNHENAALDRIYPFFDDLIDPIDILQLALAR